MTLLARETNRKVATATHPMIIVHVSADLAQVDFGTTGTTVSGMQEAQFSSSIRQVIRQNL